MYLVNVMLYKEYTWNWRSTRGAVVYGETRMLQRVYLKV